ncbi:hypothetical protein BDA96_10G249700 [Sorghum bicolor]|uniref:Uncharacterized protein n=1 Tax=Sorghum bicolor TaxID=4558 RepID=A0A921U210_SORBI|nr:hypothetical protein BDA96_10G249700 [Sorghum bicolor]
MHKRKIWWKGLNIYRNKFRFLMTAWRNTHCAMMYYCFSRCYSLSDLFPFMRNAELSKWIKRLFLHMDNASILFARDHILTLSAIAVSIKSIIKLLALSLKVSANYCAPQDQFNIT